jgi:hypothetical protein
MLLERKKYEYILNRGRNRGGRGGMKAEANVISD